MSALYQPRTGQGQVVAEPEALAGWSWGLSGLREQPPARAKLPDGHRFFRDEDRETWARFIEWGMGLQGEKDNWFATLTFRDYISWFHAEKKRNLWLFRLNQAVMDISGGQRLRWTSATEWQQRDVIHFHLLLSGTGLHNLSRKSWEWRWNNRLMGGFGAIYDTVPRAAPYLAKYMNKSRGGDMQWGGCWRGTQTPASVSVPTSA